MTATKDESMGDPVTHEQIYRELGEIDARLKSMDSRLTTTDHKLDRTNEKLDRLDSGFDQIEGGKKMAMWLFAAFGTAAGMIGVALGYFGSR